MFQIVTSCQHLYLLSSSKNISLFFVCKADFTEGERKKRQIKRENYLFTGSLPIWPQWGRREGGRRRGDSSGGADKRLEGNGESEGEGRGGEFCKPMARRQRYLPAVGSLPGCLPQQRLVQDVRSLDTVQVSRACERDTRTGTITFCLSKCT